MRKDLGLALMRHHGVSISDADDEELLNSSLPTASSDIDNMYLALPESYDNNEGDDVIHSTEFTSWMRVQLQGHLRSDESTVGGSQSSSGSTVHRSVDLPLRRPPHPSSPSPGIWIWTRTGREIFSCVGYERG
jgi:hypothetical protein